MIRLSEVGVLQSEEAAWAFRRHSESVPGPAVPVAVVGSDALPRPAAAIAGRAVSQRGWVCCSRNRVKTGKLGQGVLSTVPRFAPSLWRLGWTCEGKRAEGKFAQVNTSSLY